MFSYNLPSNCPRLFFLYLYLYLKVYHNLVVGVLAGLASRFLTIYISRSLYRTYVFIVYLFVCSFIQDIYNKYRLLRAL